MICSQASTSKIDFSFWQPMVQSIIMSFEKDWVMREMNLPSHLLCLYCLKLKRVLSHFQIRAWLYCKVKLFCIYASRSTLTSTLVAEFMACCQPAKGGTPSSKHDSEGTNHPWIQGTPEILKLLGLLSTLRKLCMMQNGAEQGCSYITSTLQAALVAKELLGAFQDAGYHL